MNDEPLPRAAEALLIIIYRLGGEAHRDVAFSEFERFAFDEMTDAEYAEWKRTYRPRAM